MDFLRALLGSGKAQQAAQDLSGRRAQMDALEAQALGGAAAPTPEELDQLRQQKKVADQMRAPRGRGPVPGG